MSFLAGLRRGVGFAAQVMGENPSKYGQPGGFKKDDDKLMQEINKEIDNSMRYPGPSSLSSSSLSVSKHTGDLSKPSKVGSQLGNMTRSLNTKQLSLQNVVSVVQKEFTQVSREISEVKRDIRMVQDKVFGAISVVDNKIKMLTRSFEMETRRLRQLIEYHNEMGSARRLAGGSFYGGSYGPTRPASGQPPASGAGWSPLDIAAAAAGVGGGAKVAGSLMRGATRFMFSPKGLVAGGGIAAGYMMYRASQYSQQRRQQLASGAPDPRQSLAAENQSMYPEGRGWGARAAQNANRQYQYPPRNNLTQRGAGTLGGLRSTPPTSLGFSGNRSGATDGTFDRFMVERQKARFLGYGVLPDGFEFLPGHMGRLGSPQAVMARGVMPLPGGPSYGGGSYGGGYSGGGYSGGGYSGGGYSGGGYSGGGYSGGGYNPGAPVGRSGSGYPGGRGDTGGNPAAGITGPPGAYSSPSQRQSSFLDSPDGRQINQPYSGGGLTGGAGLPKDINAQELAALNKVAREMGVNPAAISMVIGVESNWRSTTRTGRYNGLTQIGAATFNEAGGRLAGMTYNEFINAPREKQIEAYGAWLNHYKFKNQIQRLGIDFNKLPVERQAAFLQGFQFSPNGMGFKTAMAQGNLDVPATPHRQARELGSTSIRDMENAFKRRMANSPPVYSNESKGPGIDYSKYGPGDFSTGNIDYYKSLGIEPPRQSSSRQQQSSSSSGGTVYVGDSVASGMAQAAGARTDFSKQGLNPRQIFENIRNAPKEMWKGQRVVLSPGLLNNPQDAATVEAQIKYLKENGANIVFAGAPTKESVRRDLAGVAGNLRELAKKHGIEILPEYHAGDGVHPQSYRDQNSRLPSSSGGTSSGGTSSVSSSGGVPTYSNPHNPPSGGYSNRPFSQIITHMSGHTKGSRDGGLPPSSGTSEELSRVQQGFYGGKRSSYGYHAAVTSNYIHNQTGQKIDETTWEGLSPSEKANYREQPEIHQIRGVNTRPWHAKGRNADSYGIVTIGATTPAKADAFKQHLAQLYAQGHLSEEAIRRIYAHGELDHSGGRATMQPGGEGAPMANSLRSKVNEIIDLGNQIRNNPQAHQQQQPQAAPQGGQQQPQASPVNQDSTFNLDNYIGGYTSISKVPQHGGTAYSREFGFSRNGQAIRGGRGHAGLDIPIGMGQPFKAPMDGEVLRVQRASGAQGYGNYIDVKLQDGSIHRYAHLGTDNGSVRPFGDGIHVGAQFKKGQVIAFGGHSGAGANFPHIHHEVWTGDQHTSADQKYSASNAAGYSRAGMHHRTDPRQWWQNYEQQITQQPQDTSSVPPGQSTGATQVATTPGQSNEDLAQKYFKQTGKQPFNATPFGQIENPAFKEWKKFNGSEASQVQGGVVSTESQVSKQQNFDHPYVAYRKATGKEALVNGKETQEYYKWIAQQDPVSQYGYNSVNGISTDDPGKGRLGLFKGSTKQIFLAASSDPQERAESLTHELGHAASRRRFDAVIEKFNRKLPLNEDDKRFIDLRMEDGAEEARQRLADIERTRNIPTNRYKEYNEDNWEFVKKYTEKGFDKNVDSEWMRVRAIREQQLNTTNEILRREAILSNSKGNEKGYSTTSQAEENKFVYGAGGYTSNLAKNIDPSLMPPPSGASNLNHGFSKEEMAAPAAAAAGPQLAAPGGVPAANSAPISVVPNTPPAPPGTPAVAQAAVPSGQAAGNLPSQAPTPTAPSQSNTPAPAQPTGPSSPPQNTPTGGTVPSHTAGDNTGAAAPSNLSRGNQPESEAPSPGKGGYGSYGRCFVSLAFLVIFVSMLCLNIKGDNFIERIMFNDQQQIHAFIQQNPRSIST